MRRQGRADLLLPQSNRFLLRSPARDRRRRLLRRRQERHAADRRLERPAATIEYRRYTIAMPMMPTFYFDLGSPFAYLAAERLHEAIGERVAWRPVSLGALFKLAGRSSWSLGDPERRRAGMAEVERRARLYGLAPLRWPEPWPGNYLTAMRAATFADRQGCGPAFAMQAFRNAFQEGSDLSVPEEVLRAAADAGLDPHAVEAAIQDPDIKLALRDATEEAHALGVFGVPSVAVDGELFWGDDRLEEAAARVRGSAPPSPRRASSPRPTTRSPR